MKFLFSLINKIYTYSLVKIVLPQFVLNTDDLVLKPDKDLTILKKTESTNFYVEPTGDLLADNHFRKLIGNHQVKGQILLKVNSIFLVTSWLIPVTNNGKVLLETSGTISMMLANIRRAGDGMFPVLKFFITVLKIKFSNFFQFNFVGNLIKLDSLFHMVPRHGFDLGNPAFSHWIFENLPQVKMYYETIKENQNTKILVGPKLKEWQILSLKLLGIETNQIVDDVNKYCIKVNNFYFSRLPYIHTNVVQFDPEGRRWVREMLRKNLIEELSIEKSEVSLPCDQKIAISRFYCHRRKLINEKIYWKKLQSLGFEIIFPEKLSELDKITISYKSKVLLAFPSGSAIANMIYSKDAHLVEILPDSSYISVWFLLSRELEFDYSLVLAKTTGKGRDNDYEVSEEQILEKVANI